MRVNNKYIVDEIVTYASKEAPPQVKLLWNMSVHFSCTSCFPICCSVNCRLPSLVDYGAVNVSRLVDHGAVNV